MNAYRRHCRQQRGVGVDYGGGGSRIEVDLGHVSEYDPALLGLLMQKPAGTLPLFEVAAGDCLKSLLYSYQVAQEEEDGGDGVDESNDVHADSESMQPQDANANLGSMDQEHLSTMGEIQVLLTTSTNTPSNTLQPTDLRHITAQHMNQLLLCPGIVISAARIRSRAHKVRIRCTRCGDSRSLVTQSFSGVALPMVSDNVFFSQFFM